MRSDAASGVSQKCTVLTNKMGLTVTVNDHVPAICRVPDTIQFGIVLYLHCSHAYLPTNGIQV